MRLRTSIDVPICMAGFRDRELPLNQARTGIKTILVNRKRPSVREMREPLCDSDTLAFRWCYVTLIPPEEHQFAAMKKLEAFRMSN
jgi:hypothetical protein